MMIKWTRIFGDQYLGFWFIGLVLFALQAVPYMLMPFIHMKANPIMNMQESSAWLNIVEKVLGSACVGIMILIVQQDSKLFAIGTGRSKIGFILTIATLLLNWIGWLLYFNGHQSVAVRMFFIVVLPPLYYAFIGIWRSNWLLTSLGLIFLIVHSTHVWGNIHM